MRIARLLVVATTVPHQKGDGVPPFVVGLAKEMSTRCEQITVLAPRTQGLEEDSQDSGLEVRRFRYLPRRFETLGATAIVPELRRRPWKVLEAIALVLGLVTAVVGELRRSPPDWIHAHWSLPTGLIAVLARRIVAPASKVLVTSHGADVFALTQPIFVRLRQFVCQNADLVIPTSSDLALALGISPSLATPMGADGSIFVRRTTALNLSNRFLFVGRLDSKKGLHILLNAIEGHLGLEIDIAGDGPLRESIADSIESLGLASRVSLLGPLSPEQVADRMRRALALVVPSIVAPDGDRETGPVVVLESILSGCAVIASRVGEVPERWLRDGETALIVEPGDAKALGVAMTRVARSPDLGEQLASSAYLELAPRASMEATATRYVSLMDSGS